MSQTSPAPTVPALARTIEEQQHHANLSDKEKSWADDKTPGLKIAGYDWPDISAEDAYHYMLVVIDTDGVLVSPSKAQGFLTHVSKETGIETECLQLIRMGEVYGLLFSHLYLSLKAWALRGLIKRYSDTTHPNGIKCEILLPYGMTPQHKMKLFFYMDLDKLFDGHLGNLYDSMRDCGIIDKLTSAGAPQKKNGKMLTDAAPPHIRVIMVQFWNEEGWVEWFGNMKQERDLLERMERRNNVEAKDKDLYSFIEVRVSSASSAGKRALDADEVDGDGEAKDGMSTMGAVGGGEPTNKKRKKSFRMKPNTESARSIGKSILHSDKTFGSAPKSTADYAKMFALPIRHLSADSQPIASSSTSGNPLQSRTASEMDVDVQADEEISKDIERNEVGMIVRTGLGKGGVVQTTVDVGAFAAGLPDVDEMNNPFSGFGFKPGEDDGEPLVPKHGGPADLAVTLAASFGNKEYGSDDPEKVVDLGLKDPNGDQRIASRYVIPLLDDQKSRYTRVTDAGTSASRENGGEAFKLLHDIEMPFPKFQCAAYIHCANHEIPVNPRDLPLGSVSWVDCMEQPLHLDFGIPTIAEEDEGDEEPKLGDGSGDGDAGDEDEEFFDAEEGEGGVPMGV